MNIIFLGAGASKSLGFLAGNEILPKILEKLSSETLFLGNKDAKEKRSLLKDVFRQIAPGLSADNKDVGIGDILSLIDFSIASGITLQSRDGLFELRRIRHLIDCSIIEVLNAEPNDKTKIQSFAEVLRRLEPAVIITSNYDLIPEKAFRTASVGALDVDYGFDWRSVSSGKITRRPANNSYALLKLHGSLDWLKCPSCEQIYINHGYPIAMLGDYSDTGNYDSSVICHCGYAPLRSLLITPSLARIHPEAQLKQLVLSAIDYISQARSISIIGYSFPSEDLAIRSIFIRGMRANHFQAKVKVFQITDDAKDRYKAFFSNADYLKTGLDGFLAEHLK